MQADIHRGVYVDPRAGRITVTEYAEQWRKTLLHRGSTAKLTERKLRRHVVPVLGSMQLSAVRPSHLRGWVKDRTAHLEPSTLATVYFGLLVPMFRSAVADKLIGSSPCVGVRLPEIPDARYYIARPHEVHALADAPPEMYRAIVYLAAGCGGRAGEIVDLERDELDLDTREVHVRRQLAVTSGRRPYLAPPKTKTSARTNEVPAVVGDALRRHLDVYRVAGVDLEDETDPRRPISRRAALVFTREDGSPSTPRTGRTSGALP